MGKGKLSKPMRKVQYPSAQKLGASLMRSPVKANTYKVRIKKKKQKQNQAICTALRHSAAHRKQSPEASSIRQGWGDATHCVSSVKTNAR